MKIIHLLFIDDLKLYKELRELRLLVGRCEIWNWQMQHDDDGTGEEEI